MQLETKPPHIIGLLTYSPDGATLAAATDNYRGQAGEEILILDAATGAVRTRLRAAGGAKTAGLAFSEDGKMLYSVAADNKLRLWDPEVGAPERTWPVLGQEARPIAFAAFTPDCELLITCAMFGQELVVSEVASGRHVRTIPVPDTLGNLLAISTDGRIVASACQPITNTDTSFDERIHLWEIATGRELRSFDASGDGTVSSLAFLPDGKTLVSGMDRGSSLIWDISNIPRP
jgi:WD40 repeat protein